VSLLSKGVAICLRVQENGHGRPQGVFIAPTTQSNRYPLEQLSMGAPDMFGAPQVPALDTSGVLPAAISQW
jgi:hypothetical protein